MQINTTSRGWLPRSLCIATIAWTVAQASPAHAVINCNSGVTFSVNTSLTDNYEQTVATATPCITLTNGADLDFNGKKLTCKGGYVGACEVAVKATAAGSYVTNSTPLSKAVTSDAGSAWDTGIENAERVSYLRMERCFVGVGGTGLDEMDHNAITIVDKCVQASLLDNTSFVRNTLCQPDLRDVDSLVYGDRLGIDVTGTTSSTGPEVNKNLVVHAYGGIAATNRMRINDNIICNEVPNGGVQFGVIIDAGQTQSGTHNLCCNAPEYTTNNACKLPGEHGGNFTLWP